MHTAIVLPILVGTAWLASSAAPAPGSPEEGPGIDVVSARLANVQPAEGSAVPLLQIRLILSNPHPTLPWRFDPRATRIDLGKDGVVAPVLANADASTTSEAPCGPSGWRREAGSGWTASPSRR